jgi:hypothetical protein
MKKTILLSVLLIFFHLSYSQTDTVKSISIGDYHQGGIVFYIDRTGKHGLIAAPKNQTEQKMMWGPNGKTGAISMEDGNANTLKIIDFYKRQELDENKYSSIIRKKLTEDQLIKYKKTAAYICDTLTINGYSDWYLPAIDELLIMYENRKLIGGFIIGDYCSSTEYGKKDAYSIHIKPFKRVDFYYNKIDKDYYVRCIRKF